MSLKDYLKKMVEKRKRKGATFDYSQTTEGNKKKISRRFLIYGFLVFMFVIVFASILDSKSKKKISPKEIEKEGIQNPVEDANLAYEEWITNSGAKLKELEDAQNKVRTDYEKLNSQVSDLANKMDKLSGDIRNQLSSIQENLDKPLPTSVPDYRYNVPSSEDFDNIQQPLQPDPSELQREQQRGSIKILKNQSKAAAGKDTVAFAPFDLEEIISPAGSGARGVLITGVYATQGNAYPVLIEVVGPFYETMRRTNDKLQNAFIIGEAVGDISSSRVYVRLQKISVYLEGEDRPRTFPVYGWVTDTDGGEYGVKGRVTRRDGSFLALAIISSFLGGVGEALQAAGTITTDITGGGGMFQTQQIDTTKIWEVAAASGLSRSAEQLSQRFMDRADELQPVVHVQPGIIIDVFLLQDLKKIPISIQEKGGNS
jgi:hypothetical protein